MSNNMCFSVAVIDELKCRSDNNYILKATISTYCPVEWTIIRHTALRCPLINPLMQRVICDIWSISFLSFAHL